ncbi:hypothetical protein, partial [Curtobacterium flaccumfaciens]
MNLFGAALLWACAPASRHIGTTCLSYSDIARPDGGKSCGGAEFLDTVELLSREPGELAAEVAVGRGLRVDRSEQVE